MNVNDFLEGDKANRLKMLVVFESQPVSSRLQSIKAEMKDLIERGNAGDSPKRMLSVFPPRKHKACNGGEFGTGAGYQLGSWHRCFVFNHPFDNIWQFSERTVKDQAVDHTPLLLGHQNCSGCPHTTPPNCKLSHFKILLSLLYNFLSIFWFIDPISQKTRIAISTSYKIKANHGYSIFTYKGSEAKTLQLTSPISMQVQDGMFRVAAFLL